MADKAKPVEPSREQSENLCETSKIEIKRLVRGACPIFTDDIREIVDGEHRSPLEDVPGMGLMGTVMNRQWVITTFSDGRMKVEAKITRTRYKYEIKVCWSYTSWRCAIPQATFTSVAAMAAAHPDLAADKEWQRLSGLKYDGWAYTAQGHKAMDEDARNGANKKIIGFSIEQREAVGSPKIAYQSFPAYLLKYFPFLRQPKDIVVRMDSKRADGTAKTEDVPFDLTQMSDAVECAAAMKSDTVAARVISRTWEDSIAELEAKIINGYDGSAWSVEYLKGPAITEAYAEMDVAGCSCMSGGNRSKYVRMYEENPDVVKLAVMTHRDGKQEGHRALVWTTLSGRIAIDRVYPTGDARLQGVMRKLIMKDHPGAYDAYAIRRTSAKVNDLGSAEEGMVRIKRSKNGLYPYLDSFGYGFFTSDKEKGILLSVAESDGDLTGFDKACKVAKALLGASHRSEYFRSTEGGPFTTEDEDDDECYPHCHCNDCEEPIQDAGDAIDTGNYWVCGDCNEQYESAVNGRSGYTYHRDILEWSEHLDAYVNYERPTNGLVVVEETGHWARVEDCVQLSDPDGRLSDDWGFRDEAFAGGDWWFRSEEDRDTWLKSNEPAVASAEVV